MRQRIKTGILVYTTSSNKRKIRKIKQFNVLVKYKEKLTGNIIVKTIITKK